MGIGAKVSAVASIVVLASSLLVPTPVHAARALDQLRQAGAADGVDVQAQAPAPVAAPRAVSGATFTPAARLMPDFSFTPGKLCTTDDPDFKELRYPEQIAYCNRHVTYDMKVQVAQHYGVPQSEWGNYEFDHLIPLAIGGDSHVDNLWPQPHGPDNSDGKDKLENDLYLQLKAGAITQAEAVRQIYAWFNTNGLPKLRAALAAQAAAKGMQTAAPGAR